MTAGDMARVAILATMDTKGVEAGYLRDEIARLGGRSLLVDVGVVGDATIPVDVTASEVADLGGTPLANLRIDPNRTVASEVMVRGATSLLTRLIEENRIHGVVSMGGTQGTSNSARIMQDLPYGFPKLLVSTIAAGDTSAFVGIKDLTMMFSVGDILGLNPLLRSILTNAAGAAYGMALAYQPLDRSGGRPVVGITNLGCLTRGTMRAIARLEEKGFEAVVFHAVGAGGRAMEQMIRDGLLAGVLDYGLGDVSDHVLGGLRAGNEERLTVAVRSGLPQVIVPGGIDHIGIQLAKPNTVPELYARHRYAYHNPTILVPRPSREETRAVVAEIARRLRGPAPSTVVMIPRGGVSSYSAPGGELFDPGADEDLLAALREMLDPQIERVEVDANIEDATFVDGAVDQLLLLIEARTRT